MYAEHSCSPWTTTFVPALTQLPLFVFGTAALSALTSRPSPLNDETFLTLTSLAHPDPTGVLPVVLGLVTLANVETANWFIGSERALRNAQLEENRKKADAQRHKEGKVVRLRAKDAVQGSLRGLSVARILIGAMVDGVSSLLARRFFTEYLYFSPCYYFGFLLQPSASSSHGLSTGGMHVEPSDSNKRAIKGFHQSEVRPLKLHNTGLAIEASHLLD